MFYDENLINIWKCILLQFLLLPDGKNIHQHKKCLLPEEKNIYQHNKYLSESYAAYAVGSTSSNVKNILDFITLLHKYNGRYMAFRWKIDWFLYYQKYLMLWFLLRSFDKHLYNFWYKTEKYRWQNNTTCYKTVKHCFL